MRSFAVLLLAIVALAFAANTTSTEAKTSTVVSNSYSVSDTATQQITATASKPITKSESAETTFTTSYTVSASETQAVTTAQVVTSSQKQTSTVLVTTGVTGSAVISSTAEATTIITGSKSEVGPTAAPPTSAAPIPDITGTWATSDYNNCVSSDVFDTTYIVSKVNGSFFEFSPAHPTKFSGGLVQEFTNGTFVTVSWSAVCFGFANGNAGNITCLVPTSAVALVCTAKLTLTSTASTYSNSDSASYSKSSSHGPTSTEVAYTDISGRWKISNVNCANPAAFDKAYDVTKINNTVYVFNPVDSKYTGGLVLEYDAQSFVGVSSALIGCKGIIDSSNTAKISCLIDKATCSAVLTRENDVSTTATSPDGTSNNGSASSIAMSFVLLALIALF